MKGKLSKRKLSSRGVEAMFKLTMARWLAVGLFRIHSLSANAQEPPVKRPPQAHLSIDNRPIKLGIDKAMGASLITPDEGVDVV